MRKITAKVQAYLTGKQENEITIERIQRYTGINDNCRINDKDHLIENMDRSTSHSYYVDEDRGPVSPIQHAAFLIIKLIKEAKNE